MLAEALEDGWHSVETIPIKGDGDFLVITLSGLQRLARNRNQIRRYRKSDGYGPARANVISVGTTNYLAAIAWKWPEPTTQILPQIKLKK